MADHNQPLTGPDFKSGIEFSTLIDNEPLLGHYEGEAVVMVRKGSEVLATSAICTHYSGPLADGIVVGDTIRCPWHHARFSLRTGEAAAPALNPLSCFAVEHNSGLVKISGKKKTDTPAACPLNPSSVVIVGAGAAGSACAEMLRTKGYSGPIALVGDEPPGPVDRPNLSKDYLAGAAPDEWIPLRPPDYYSENRIDLTLDDPVTKIEPSDQKVSLRSGRTLSYGALFLATGAEPRTLPVEGADLPHVYRLRTLADCKAILALVKPGVACALIGSGFIGLEVAASLRAREVDVTVISQDPVPLVKILGEELGRHIQKVHEQHGVRFHLNTKPKAIHEDRIELENGKSVAAGLVVIGVSVSPRTSLAGDAGLKIGSGNDDGVTVDQELRTNKSAIFAGGDIARYPELVSGEPARIEHWVVARRHGEAAARSMLGIGDPFREAPFFWTTHYDVTISYVGHASKWDSCEVKGSLEKNDACAIYRLGKKVLAAATINRDRLLLKIEAAMESRMESGDEAKLETILQEAE